MIKSSGKKFNHSKKYNGGKKFQLLLILPDEFNKRTEIKSPWNNYKHSSYLILLLTYFPACNFEKLMLYVLLFLARALLHQFPHEKILN